MWAGILLVSQPRWSGILWQTVCVIWFLNFNSFRRQLKTFLFAHCWAQRIEHIRDIMTELYKLNKLNTNPQHCLVPLLPPVRNLETRSTLRAWGHRFSLPQCKSKLYKDAYINRVLFLYFKF